MSNPFCATYCLGVAVVSYATAVFEGSGSTPGSYQMIRKY